MGAFPARKAVRFQGNRYFHLQTPEYVFKIPGKKINVSAVYHQRRLKGKDIAAKAVLAKDDAPVLEFLKNPVGERGAAVSGPCRAASRRNAVRRKFRAKHEPLSPHFLYHRKSRREAFKAGKEIGPVFRRSGAEIFFFDIIQNRKGRACRNRIPAQR
jgi:hypothetical protein